MPISKRAMDLYAEIYPGQAGAQGLVPPIDGATLYEMGFRAVDSDVHPNDVSLGTQIGPVILNCPIISAAMDTVTGAELCNAMFLMGGAGIRFRDKDPEDQLRSLEKTLKHEPLLVTNPMTLRPHDTVEKAREIMDQHDFSTIPIVDEDGVLQGILFTRGVVFEGNYEKPVKDFMKPFSNLKRVNRGTSFDKVRNRMTQGSNTDAVLPVVDKNRLFHGIYFVQDFFNINPIFFEGKPLVGMAVSVEKDDVNRVHEAIDLGVGIIVIDSSHGACTEVYEQTKRVIEAVKGRAAIIAGNITDIDGYLMYHELGVDAAKLFIGTGSICTTSSGTGVAFPTWQLIRELAYVRNKLIAEDENPPVLIPDGGINSSGAIAAALGAGGHAVMCGEYLVGAHESRSYQQGDTMILEGVEVVKYRGMASEEAIKARMSYRYGQRKRAAEGVSGWVPVKGPLKKWLTSDLELVRGGLAHAGARTIDEFHKYGNLPYVWSRFSATGQSQIATRINTSHV